MRYSKLFVHSTLLLTIPSLALYPQGEIPAASIPPQVRSILGPSSNPDLPITYDDLLRFIDDLESGELEKRCTPEDLEVVQQFIINLARVGVLPGDEAELEKDIEELLRGESADFSIDEDYEYLITPAILKGEYDFLPCGSWPKKQWKRIKNAVKKHKKAIIIGAVAVVVVVAVVVTVGAAAPAAAAGAAAAAMDGDEEDDEDESAEPPPAPPTDPAPVLKETLGEHLSILKEAVVDENLLPISTPENNDEPTLGEKARNLGALLAHHVFDGVTDVGAIVPIVADAFQSKPPSPLQERISFVDGYHEFIANCHESIDQFFSTNQAERFAEHVKEAMEKRVMTGEIPPPSCLFEAVGATARSIASVTRFRTAIQAGAEAAAAAEELGLSSREIIQLQRSGALEKTVATNFDAIGNDWAMRMSVEKFRNAETLLKPYRGQYLPEMQIRELIRQAGIETPARPVGIPESFRIKLADKPGGIKYVHPQNEETYVRIMAGKPHSPFPYQRNPYVVEMRNGKTLDKFGNIVDPSAPEAHIPLEDYIYRGD